MQPAIRFQFHWAILLLITNTYLTFLVTNPIPSTSDNTLLARFPFPFTSTHAISHAAPHAVSRDNHQATPNLTGPFNTHHLEPYVDHHDRPFGNEMKIMFMLNVNLSYLIRSTLSCGSSCTHSRRSGHNPQHHFSSEERRCPTGISSIHLRIVSIPFCPLICLRLHHPHPHQRMNADAMDLNIVWMIQPRI